MNSDMTSAWSSSIKNSAEGNTLRAISSLPRGPDRCLVTITRSNKQHSVVDTSPAGVGDTISQPRLVRLGIVDVGAKHDAGPATLILLSSNDKPLNAGNNIR